MKPSRSLLLAALCLALALPASAGDASFHRLVGTLSRHYQTRPVAGLGFAAFVARLFTPSGVHRLSLAVFDELPEQKGPIEDATFERAVREAVDPSYIPFIRVISGPRHELTCVYLREAGKSFDLLLVTAQSREAVVVGMRLDPDAMAKWMDDPEGMSRKCGKGL